MRIRNPFSKKAFFNRYRKKKYRAFLRSNYEWDYRYLIDMMILKLTLMGLQFAKFGCTVDNRTLVRKIWEIRKALIQSRQAFDWAETEGQKKYKEKYGAPFEYTLFGSFSNESWDKWREICPHDAEYKREKECLDKAFFLLARDIQSLSD